jgi:hypothetical protein
MPDPGPLSSRDARINNGQVKQHTEMKMKMLQGFALIVTIALVPAIAIAQSASEFPRRSKRSMNPLIR